MDKVNHYKMDTTGTTSKLINHFKNVDIPVKKINLNVMIKTKSSRGFFRAAYSNSLGLIGFRIANNKHLQKEFLKKAGISVIESELFQGTEKEQAKEMAKKLPSTVIKPLDGLQAKGVSIGVEGDSEFNLAWDAALKASKQKKILVEENFQQGILARYLVVDGKCISIVEFTKPFVTGNSKNTIEELIYIKNEVRKLNPHLKDGLLKITETYLKNIEAQGYHLLSIPEEGKNIVLDHRANPKIGSDTIDITDNVHPLFKKIAEDATKAIPGLSVAGIDLLAVDHTIEPQKNNYSVIEMNSRPGLGGHLYNLYGYPRNVIKSIANHILKTIKTDELINHIKNPPVEDMHNICSSDDHYNLDQIKKPNQYSNKTKYANKLIEKEFEKLGYQGFCIEKYFVVSIEGKLIAFDGSLSSNFSLLSKRILEDQYWSRKFLTEDKLSVSEGEFFDIKSKEEALKYAKNYNMKVQLGYKREKVLTSSQKEFDKAWGKISRIYNKKRKTRNNRKKRGILVTKLYNEEIKSRYLIIDGDCVGVIQYIPSPKGDFDTFNITPYAHQKFKKIAEKAARIVLGADIIGVDIVTKNHLKDPEESGYAIVDLKVRPSIREFHYPTYGEPQNIARAIVDYSIHWASRKKQFEELTVPMEESELMPDKVLNNNKTY